MNNSNRAIVIWLLTGCVLIFLMVAIGGLTRLTHSGLSMVEWTLFGSTPPGTDADWQVLFDKYKQFPEYQKVNFNFSLEEFKSIFYWEYAHRMFGRFIGLVFILPFLWFLLRRKINKTLLPKLLIILFMGGFQGLLGWYMVKSGLIKNPDVSHYRLAMHLLTAFLTFAYTLWVALDLALPQSKIKNTFIKRGLVFVLLLGLIQVVWGAFVAGLNAGMVYNTWPKMGSAWIADSVFAMQPWWKNLVEGIAGVQFVHRYLAYFIVAGILVVFFKSKALDLEPLQRKALNLLVLAVACQFVLGIFTIITAVPISLGLFHQLGAYLLLGTCIFALNRFSH